MAATDTTTLLCNGDTAGERGGGTTLLCNGDGEGSKDGDSLDAGHREADPQQTLHGGATSDTFEGSPTNADTPLTHQGGVDHGRDSPCQQGSHIAGGISVSHDVSGDSDEDSPTLEGWDDDLEL